MQLLAVVARLGRHQVSAQLLVETWREQGRVADDAFFMHYDTLFEYDFLQVVGDSVVPVPLTKLLGDPIALETQVSMTKAGSDFLERYGSF